MEGLDLMTPDFWTGRQVFLTGHTGFKGAWLSLWLLELGAVVTGFSQAPASTPNLFDEARLADDLNSVIGDIRDLQALSAALAAARPEVVIHMAAQALVRESYADPVGTYSTNVLGTVNLLEAVRTTPSVRAIVNVTSDKCYHNQEWEWGYRENEPMGGHDPYSSSKGCAELVTAAFRSSFFAPQHYDRHRVAVGSARAGNVIGGGDWSRDRLLPDILRFLAANSPPQIRSPRAVRPWQYVLEPISGYLELAERLYLDGPRFGEGWNFGPSDLSTRPVWWIVDRVVELMGKGAIGWTSDEGNHPHEASQLKLDSSKARKQLGWQPRWTLEQSLERVVKWHLAHQNGDDVRRHTLADIRDYQRAAPDLHA